jgi:hypothetical protein
MAVTSWWSLVRKAVIAAMAAATMVAVAGQATAVADVTNNVAVCHSTEVSGVETDNCVGNPTAANGPDESWNQVLVRPRLWLGIGIG